MLHVQVKINLFYEYGPEISCFPTHCRLPAKKQEHSLSFLDNGYHDYLPATVTKAMFKDILFSLIIFFTLCFPAFNCRYGHK